MKNVVGILREGLSKKGENRVAITPESAKQIVGWGHNLIVQSATHPVTGEVKRAFEDYEYVKSGAVISEDLSDAKIIFGLKEIDTDKIFPEKVYCFFSHTHKGQLKNRRMLKALIENKSTLVDYELIRNENNVRLVTAFTYNAGYAGIVDSLWTLGIRLKNNNISNPFALLNQAVKEKHFINAKDSFTKTANDIEIAGTPKELPPIIVCFLGKGKTAKGARELFNILPHEDINIEQLKDVYQNGSKNKLYALHIDIEEIYRMKKDSNYSLDDYNKLNVREKQKLYFNNPELFETNLDTVLPYITILMNCIIWSKKYPRTTTKSLTQSVYKTHRTLQVIGDITCDPNGSIEFSKETWIDNPVYIYNPETETITDGFEGDGIAVMAVTNLPCEFSADASIQFNSNLAPFYKNILSADYKKTFADSTLAPEIKRAIIMWNGEFTEDFKYMKEFIEE